MHPHVDMRAALQWLECSIIINDNTVELLASYETAGVGIRETGFEPFDWAVWAISFGWQVLLVCWLSMFLEKLKPALTKWCSSGRSVRVGAAIDRKEFRAILVIGFLTSDVSESV